MAEYGIPFLMGVFGGTLSWFATNFVGTPLTRFYKMKEEVHSSMILYANVSPVYEREDPRKHPDWDRFLEAHTKFRQLSSELSALALNHALINRILGRFGYQAVDAASGLMGFANTLASPAARRRGELAWNRDRIERSLKFPLSYPDGVKVREE